MIRDFKDEIIASLLASNDENRTAFHLAAYKRGHRELIEILASNDLDYVSAEGLTTVHLAAQSGSVSAVSQILVDSPGISERAVQQILLKSPRSYPERFTALHIAANVGYLEIVACLLLLQANPMDKDILGRTSLHYAAREGHESVVKRLLECEGVEVDAEDSDGVTALHLAASEGHRNVVSMLLSQGADVNKVKKMSHKCLNYCNLLAGVIKNWHLAGAPRLFDCSLWAAGGSSALHFACRKKNMEAVRELVGREGVKLDLRVKAGFLAYDVARLREIGEEFKSAVRNVRGEWVAGELERDVSSVRGNDEWERAEAELVEYRRQTDCVSRGGKQTAQAADVWAARRGYVAEVARLVRKHSNLANEVDVRGNTPLVLAFKYGHADVASFLLNANVRLNHCDMMERALLSLGEFSSHKDDKMAIALGTLVNKYSLSPDAHVTIWKWSLQNAQWKLATDFLQMVNASTKREFQLWCQGNNFKCVPHEGETLPSKLVEFLKSKDKGGNALKKRPLHHEERSLYVSCGAALMIGSALFASLAYQGWLQPPLAIGAQDSIHIFWWSNHLIFYLSIASMIAAGPIAIPYCIETNLLHESKFKPIAFKVSSVLLTLSLIAIIVAFTDVGWALSPRHARDHIIMKVISSLGIVLCAILMLITCFLCYALKFAGWLYKDVLNMWKPWKQHGVKGQR